MIILAVHTTTRRLSAAVTQNGRVLHENILPPGREHLENLAPIILGISNRLKISLEHVDGFAVAVGPGSFSGIRVGLATVKGVALALGKPVVGVSSLEILAWLGLTDGEIGAAVIDARRGELFAGIYRKSGKTVALMKGPFLTKLDLLEKLAELTDQDNRIVCSERAVENLPEGNPGAWISRIVTPSASACALMAEERFRRGTLQDLHSITPLYVRRSDAEDRLRVG